MTKKIKTSMTLTNTMLNKLKGQARELGMDVSSYIAYLVLWKEEIDKKQTQSIEVMKEINKTMTNFVKSPELLAQLIKNKGDE